LLDHAVLEELGYMDEIYAPQGTDDIDLCYRAWKRGLVCGVYPMHAFFKIEDGTTRQNPNSDKVTSISWMKNEKILISRYLDIITGPKHTEVRILED
jgi:GT2 family glycosyltransferase